MNPRLLIALAVAATALATALVVGDRLDLGYLQQQHATLVAARTAQPAALAVGYFLTFLVTSALSLPSAGLLMVAAGALFGFAGGLPLAVVSSAAGAAVSFLLSRYLLRDWVRRRFAAWLASVDEGVAREGAFYVFAMRMIPAIPFFVINPVMGLTGLSLRRFLLATILGLLPAMSLLVFAGTRLAGLKSIGDILDAPLIAALTLLGVFPLLARRFLAVARRRRQ